MDNPIDFVGGDKNDKDKMSKQECQQAIEEYFAEYGQDAPYVDYRENKVFARDAGENFFVIRKINGRAVAPTQNLALGSMSDDGRVMTINFYNADENMGDNAEKFQKNLDRMESRNERKNTVWHEEGIKLIRTEPVIKCIIQVPRNILNFAMIRKKAHIENQVFESCWNIKKQEIRIVLHKIINFC
jgi:hypothetical protein